MDASPAPSPPSVWSEAFRVRAGEIGPRGVLRPTALCDLLQEAAGNHADALGFGAGDLRARGLAWVLSRLTLRVARLPAWREEVRVETWPSGVLRLWALREFRVLDRDGVELARATSGWLVVRRDGKRPVRPFPEVATLAARAPARALDDPFLELAPPAPGEPAGAFRVGRSDVDPNEHANNVALLRFLLDAPPALPEPPFDLSVEFRGEAFAGDSLLARAESAGGATRVALVGERSGREVARSLLA